MYTAQNDSFLPKVRIT